jgi:hypothetical protein
MFLIILMSHTLFLLTYLQSNFYKLKTTLYQILEICNNIFNNINY